MRVLMAVLILAAVAGAGLIDRQVFFPGSGGTQTPTVAVDSAWFVYSQPIELKEAGRNPALEWRQAVTAGDSVAVSVYFQWSRDGVNWDSRVDTVLAGVTSTGVRYTLEPFYPRIAREFRFRFDNAAGTALIGPVWVLADDQR